jgi:N-acylglucosamine-6-phosphate 2-epimerase
MSNILEKIKSGLIVSCQAPKDSPLHDPIIIAAIAQAAVNQGAVGVRIDTPEHIKAVRQKLPHIPIIGLWKQTELNSAVYITPRFADAVAVAEAGADLIAIDATQRQRPNGEIVSDLIGKIQQQLGKLVMADLDTLDNAIAAEAAGVDLIGTTLYGYTEETQNCTPPGYDLLSQLVETSKLPIICEGGIASPEMAQKALDLGAYSIVVGTAITGIDLQVKAYTKFLTRNI